MATVPFISGFSRARKSMKVPPMNRIFKRAGALIGQAAMLFGLGLLWLASRLPLRWQQRLGKALGTVAHAIYPYRKDVALTNLRLCFPDWTEERRKALVKAHFQSMGIGLFELGTAWWGKNKTFRNLANVTGVEHLKRLEAEGRGALLLSAHFTTLEIVGRFLNEDFRFSCLYRNPNNPLVARFMEKARARQMKTLVHFDDMMGMIRALKRGEFLWYAPDQGKVFKYTSILPFFGEPAVTNTATGRIAKMGNAAIVPFFGKRDADGRYTIEIQPPLETLPTNDPEADALAVNKLIEGFIERAPEQYFWLHRRFKYRGPEYPDVYAKAPVSLQ